MTTFSQVDPDLLFPDSDGKPMADNTEQFRWIVTIKENLEILFAAREDVFIAGDLLWYPLKSTLVAPTAPDAMVVFGRPKGRRGSYQQWQEEGIAPQVVFEILSPSNTAAEMARKREFYETYGVEEYYQFDPDRLRLQGWQRQAEQLVEIPKMIGWVSPRLGIRFGLSEVDMELYRPDGQRFLTSIELEARAVQAESNADRQKLIANEQQARAEQAEAQLQQVVQNLLRSGLPIEQVAQMTGLSIAAVIDYSKPT
jgi:Uma2 family endonuclease